MIVTLAINLRREQIGYQRPGKQILRKILNKYLPDYKISAVKKGFSVPLHNWMRFELRDLVCDIIHSDCLKHDEILNTLELKKYVETFMASGLGNAKFIWGCVLYGNWKQKWKVL